MKSLEKEFEEWLKTCPIEYTLVETYGANHNGQLIKHRVIDFRWWQENTKQKGAKICIN
jgi:hypothetical protein